MLKQLIDVGAFGSNFDSVKFTDGGSPALLASGKAGFELMGSWEYSTQQDANPTFAASDLDYSAFPSVSDGTGDPNDIVGNPNNFYLVLKKTEYPRPSRSSSSSCTPTSSSRRGEVAPHQHDMEEPADLDALLPESLGQLTRSPSPARYGSWTSPAACTPR